MATEVKLGFIGAGIMAEAIARTVLKAGLFRPQELMASDPLEPRRQAFTNHLGVPAITDNKEVTRRADTLLLAVKPQQMEAALAEMKPALREAARVISIAAGISTKYIESRLAGRPRVIRVMPNTPMLAGAGVSVLCKGRFAVEEDLGLTERIFATGGKTFRLDEEHMNAATAVSGSGPAYFFLFVEAITEGALAAGIPADIAQGLVIGTFSGAARLLETSGDDPRVLRKRVTSPGGTTEAAIASMKADNVVESIGKAVVAATYRAEELGK